MENGGQRTEDGGQNKGSREIGRKEAQKTREMVRISRRL
jgi:hypothetical protein